jgi:hypothetical protein
MLVMKFFIQDESMLETDHQKKHNSSMPRSACKKHTKHKFQHELGPSKIKEHPEENRESRNTDS